MILVILAMTIAVPALAATRTTGWSASKGGIDGTCKVCGTLNYENKETGDYAQAITESKAVGTLGARAVIWYTNASGNTNLHKDSIKDNVTKVSTVKAVAPEGLHGYKVTSGHTYRSTAYGSWSKGLSYTF